MDFDFDPIDSLVNDIKGTTNYLSKILSPRRSFVFAAVILGAVLVVRFLGI